VNHKVDRLKEIKSELDRLKAKQRKKASQKLEHSMKFMQEVSKETKERVRGYKL